jgi:acetyl esterase/lipase
VETTLLRAGQGARLAGLAIILIGLCRTSFAAPLAAPAEKARGQSRAEPRVVRNVHYGSDIRQRFDVYAPPDAKGAPVIFMVHGGGWAYGDKSARGVTENKVKRWVPRGFIVISTNYRMLPKADPLEQAKDVARAVAVAQQRAASWGGDPAKFILMGHSAGAHLVALLNASPSLAGELPITPWLGVVSIESGALDVVAIMRAPHARLYDRAFGRDTAYWRTVSPMHAVTQATAPILVVCSIRRPTSCARSDRFAAKASALGSRAAVLREDLSHAEADARLGVDPGYTRGVESFMRTLDVGVEQRLAPPPPQ